MVAVNLIFAIFLIIHRMALFHLENFTAAKEAFSDALKLDSKQNKIYFILRKRKRKLFNNFLFLAVCLLLYESKTG